jgi:hypothetical protein
MRSRITLAVVTCAALAFGAGAAAAGKPTPAGQPKHQAAKAKHDDRALFAVMTGRNEVDANGHRGAGDVNGSGSVTAMVDGNQICFGITVKNLGATPIAAHIHGPARPNQNAGIVVALAAPPSPDPGASSGCVAVDAALAQEILKHPHKYYVNVHTTQFPGGAIRGQLSRRSH